MARHPKQDMVVYGGKLGTVRIYKISDNQNRTAARNDTNLVRLFERQAGPVTAVAYSPEGDTIAVGSTGADVILYKTADGARAAALKGHNGAVYALHYRPDGKAIVTAGFDGTVRIFELPSGNLLKEFPAGPVNEGKTAGK
jgi:WD40 repeat protein